MPWPYDDQQPSGLLDPRLLEPLDVQPESLGGGLAPPQRGGLLARLGGGIRRGADALERGIGAVTSHPLYARAWQGAVSGMEGDAMAGPRAMERLRRAQAPSIQDELNMYRLKQFQRQEEEAAQKAELRKALGYAVASGDPGAVREVYGKYDPAAAAGEMLKPDAVREPKAVTVGGETKYGTWNPETNSFDFVPGVGGPKSPPIQIDMGTKDIAGISRAEREAFVKQVAPFEALEQASASLRGIRGMADKNGILPDQARQVIASDAMRALRPEALNEGDVSRLTAVGLWNSALNAIGLPPKMTTAQLDTLLAMIEQKRAQAEPLLRAAIEDARYRANEFGFAPRLILGRYDASSPAPAPAPRPQPVPGNGTQLPAGWKLEPMP